MEVRRACCHTFSERHEELSFDNSTNGLMGSKKPVYKISSPCTL